MTSATLHNQDFITEKDIRVGDTVLVRKAGEIIPEVLSVVAEERPEGTQPYRFPQVCPVCGARWSGRRTGPHPLHRSGVPRPAAAQSGPLRQPGRHGHRGPGHRGGGEPGERGAGEDPPATCTS